MIVKIDNSIFNFFRWEVGNGPFGGAGAPGTAPPPASNIMDHRMPELKSMAPRDQYYKLLCPS